RDRRFRRRDRRACRFRRRDRPVGRPHGGGARAGRRHPRPGGDGEGGRRAQGPLQEALRLPLGALPRRGVGEAHRRVREVPLRLAGGDAVRAPAGRVPGRGELRRDPAGPGPPPGAEHPRPLRAGREPHEPRRRPAPGDQPAVDPGAVPEHRRGRGLLVRPLVPAHLRAPDDERLPDRPRRLAQALRDVPEAAALRGADPGVPRGGPPADRHDGRLQPRCGVPRDQRGRPGGAGRHHRRLRGDAQGAQLADPGPPARACRLRGADRRARGRGGGRVLVADPRRGEGPVRRASRRGPGLCRPGRGGIRMSERLSAREVKRHKWWGWGLDDVTFRYDNKPAFAPLARNKVGVDLDSKQPVEPQLSDFEVPPSRLPGAVRDLLVDVVGEENLADDDEYRVVHSFGRSLPDLFRARNGHFERLVDAIVYPVSEEEVAQILRIVLEKDLVLIPYGGGSCISGSVTPDVSEQRPILTMNLGRLREVIEIDDTAGLARVEAGAYGPDLEEQLNALGWTVGHFPDSFTYSTVGGWAATRSSGMQSDKYGDIEDIVRGLRMVHPDGVAVTKPIPGRDSGPSVHEMILGSEGRLGIITEVTLQVHRITPVRQVIAYL